MLARTPRPLNASHRRSRLSLIRGRCFARNNALLNEDVDKTLERLHVLLGKQVVVHSHSHKVNKAAVEFEVSVDMPEWVVPVAVVQVGVASEHLLDDALHILVEILGEIGWLADPVLGATSKSVHRGVQIGRWGTNWCLSRAGSAWEITSSKSSGLNVLGWVGREDMRVVDLADNPSLDTNDIGRSGDLGGSAILEPSVCESAGLVKRDMNHVDNLPSSRHRGAGNFVAQSHASVSVHLLDDLNHAGQQSVHLNNYLD